MVQVGEDEFWAACEDALAGLPREFRDALDNLAILVSDEPPAGEDPQLLGLYEGLALTEREGYGFCPPDTITIFRGPHERMCDSVDQLRREVAVTLRHEIGHHFGIDDERLRQLGWG